MADLADDRVLCQRRSGGWVYRGGAAGCGEGIKGGERLMSRYSSYDDADAKCPYYTGSTITDIRCEGLENGQCIIVRFASRDARNMFRAKHCDSMKGYESCPIKRAHE